jgi:polysaccharide biosynthesis protein PslH
MIKPKILFVTSSWPEEQTFGGQLRALHLRRALEHVGKVTLTVVSSNSHDKEVSHKSSEEVEVNATIHTSVKPNRGVISKLRWAIDPSYLNLHGTVAAAEDCKRMLLDLARYDLVWILNSRIPNILQQWHWPHSHLDIDDVPSTYYQTLSRSNASLAECLKAHIKAMLLKRRELFFRHRFTTLSVCSQADREYLGGGDQIHVIPNGFERPVCAPVPNPVSGPPRIGFIGLCSYAPNIEGVRWFLGDVWPRIRAVVPGIRFRLVGKDSDKIAGHEADDVDTLGWVEEPAEEIASWSAMVIPIRLGGGTRIKIADAFSRKCPAVSTSFGAFGYEVTNGRELLIADDPSVFAAACVSLIRDPSSGAQMAERAYRTFLERWTWDTIAPRVWAAAEDCLRRSSRQRSSAPQTRTDPAVSVGNPI